MEKKFNIGDRVRFIRNYDDDFVYVDKGDCGTIESADTYFGIQIVLDSPECVSLFDTDYIELITPYDQKTAFLTELKDLMNKHGVRFGIDLENKDVSFSFGDGEVSVFSEEFLKIATDIKSKH